jgi:hypothetical protein
MALKNVNEFYSEALVPLSPKPELVPLLKAIMNCGETTKDFVWALRNDHDLQSWLRFTVGTMGFDTKKLGLEQVITLLGQDKVRDILLGRSLERSFVSSDETVMAKHFSGSKKKPTNTSDDEGDAEAPPIAEFGNYLIFSKKAEQVANNIRNSYPWQAFVGGLLFDYLYHFLNSKKIESVDELKRPDLVSPKAFLEGLFAEGLRSAIAAQEVLQKISIKHQKNVFIASLLASSGKAIQLGFDPLSYQALLNEVDQRAALGISTKQVDIETKFFALDHRQVTSLFLGRLPFLQETERVIDYATSPKILRMRDSNLYALHCVLWVGAELGKKFQKERSSQSDINKIDVSEIQKSDEFIFLKLSIEEWKEIKSNFALKIMKASL